MPQVQYRIDPHRGWHLHKLDCSYAQGKYYITVSEEDIYSGKYLPSPPDAMKSWVPCHHCMLGKPREEF
jgi:hypothetical protein